MKRIDAIAFDLDHTLYDRNETWSALTASFMRVFETSLSGEQLLRSLRGADYESTYEESRQLARHASKIAALGRGKARCAV